MSDLANHLEHNPRAKQQIKDALHKTLYEALDKDFQERLNRIIIRNTVLGRFTHKSFIFQNEIYNCDTDPLPRKMNRLLPELQDEFKKYLYELTELNMKEVPYVLGFINQMMNMSNSLEDYLKLLPESLHDPIKQLIHTCPCRSRLLTDSELDVLQQKNTKAIDLMKQRMVKNLLL